MDLNYNKKKTLNKKYICLIPARAGSKRVPNKNIKNLNSKPLIKYSIDFAKSIFDNSDIYLTSDSKEALDIGRKSQINIHTRPKFLAQDNSSMLDATINFIDFFNFSDDINIVLLQPTNPFRDKAFYLKLKSLFEQTKNATSAISLIKCSFFHPSKIGKIDSKNYFRKLEHILPEENIDNHKKMAYYVISGTYYIVPVYVLKNLNSFIGNNPVGLPEDEASFCNIDKPSDFAMAELLVRNIEKNNIL